MKTSKFLWRILRTSPPSRLAIPTADGMEYLNPKEIIRIEADRSYSWFYLTGGRKILVSKHLKEFQELLSDRYFFRSHNSHLINLKYVKKYIRKEGGYIEMTDGAMIPVSQEQKRSLSCTYGKIQRDKIKRKGAFNKPLLLNTNLKPGSAGRPGENTYLEAVASVGLFKKHRKIRSYKLGGFKFASLTRC